MNSSSTAKSTNNLTKQQTHRRTGQCLPSATTQHSLVSALARNHPQRYQTRKHHDHQTQHHQTHRFWTQQLLSATPTAHHLLWQSLLCSPRNALQTTLLSSKGGDVELWSCSLHHALRLPSVLSWINLTNLQTYPKRHLWRTFSSVLKRKKYPQESPSLRPWHKGNH